MIPHFNFHYLDQYSQLLKKKILDPKYVGSMDSKTLTYPEMRLCISQQGRITDGFYLKLFVLVDETDGVIADIKFQAFGESALVGALEILCSLAIRKNYDQARRLTTELMEKEVKQGDKGFPSTLHNYLNVALSALDDALENCDDIPFADQYAPPTPFKMGEEQQHAYPNFLELSEVQKKSVLHEVIEKDIRPYIELDAGGVDIVSIDGYNLKVRYQGACTSCYSATGSTLSAIEHILKGKVHPDITVEADLANLQFAID